MAAMSAFRVGQTARTASRPVPGPETCVGRVACRPPRTHVCAVVFAGGVFVFLGACERDAPSADNTRGTSAVESAVAEETRVHSQDPDSLRLQLAVPPRAARGEAVPIEFTVENISGRGLDLYLRGREIAFDIVVESEDGGLVWRRLHDAIIPAILRIESLAPGAVLEFRDTWDQRTNEGDRVAPGRYRVRGELLTEAEPLATQSADIQVGADP